LRNGQSGFPDCDPFLARVLTVVERWIACEWNEREAFRRAAACSGWTKQHRSDYEAAALTVENLAHRLDNISISKLRRELKRLGAPAPGEIIRKARIDYAKHLLITSRMLVREVSARAGYDSEKHFAEQFQRATGFTPSAYRRTRI
jgi:AraC-like DNA-binding protein